MNRKTMFDDTFGDICDLIPPKHMLCHVDPNGFKQNLSILI